jgi:hypothetical protein
MPPVAAHSLKICKQGGSVCYVRKFCHIGRDVKEPPSLEWGLTTENSRTKDNRDINEKVQCSQESELTS